jgi:hypothetical protein
MSFFDITACTTKEVLHEVAKHLDGIFTSRKWWDVVISDMVGSQILSPKVQFPPKFLAWLVE